MAGVDGINPVLITKAAAKDMTEEQFKQSRYWDSFVKENTKELDAIVKAIDNKTMTTEEVSKAFFEPGNKVSAYHDKIAELTKEQADPEVAQWYKNNGYDLVKLYKENYNDAADSKVRAIRTFLSVRKEYQGLFDNSFHIIDKNSDPPELQKIKKRVKDYIDRSKSTSDQAKGLEKQAKPCKI